MSITRNPTGSKNALQPAVLVTGASTGIGRAIAILLSGRGFVVYAGVRKKTDKSDLEHQGKGKIIAIQLDVRSDSDISNAVTLIEGNHDILLVALVNNAGVCKTGLMERCSRSELLDMFDVNSIGPLVLGNALLPLLQRAGGRIINIGSTSGQVPDPLNGAYCASKAALAMLGQVMSIEYSAKGIHVISIQPGVVATPFWKKIAAFERLQRHRLNIRTMEEFASRQKLLNSFAKNGNSTPEEVAATILVAIVSKRPKQNYVVGSDAKRRLIIFKLLPQWLYNFLISRKFNTR